jgi:ribosomal protein S18 acetylase RimI-like enzyme
MQIRQMSLKELDIIFNIVKQLRVELSYNEFEDLVYDMRDDYIMIGILEKDTLVCYAGVSIMTNLYYKRHLFIHEFIVDKNYKNSNYAKEMILYLKDYAKMAMCKNIVLFSSFNNSSNFNDYKDSNFGEKNLIISLL